MKPSLRLGIELPPVPVAATPGNGAPGQGPVGHPGLDAWWRAAVASMAAGAGTVWSVGSPASGRQRPGEAWCDPCTLAGALAPVHGGASIGVVSPVPGGRHPSVLARDVTTVDVLSRGRAALQVRWDAPGPTDLSVACEHLADAVAVCAAMLRGGDPVHDGRYFRVSGALNLPSPRQDGGPPVLVASPGVLDAELAAVGGRPGRLAELARRTVVLADAVVCGSDAATVAAWRAVIGDGGHEGAAERTPGLVCTLRAPGPTVAPERATAAVRAASGRARDAGADGVVLVLEPDTPVERLERLAAAAFAPWAPARP